MKTNGSTSNGSSASGTRKRYTPEFKAQLVQQMLREEKSVSQLAAEHGIHPHQLYQWRDQALQTLHLLFSDQSAREQAAKDAAHERQVQRLYAQIGKLTTQLEWLKKKWACLIQMRGTSMSKNDLLALFDHDTNSVGLSIRTQAALLKLSRNRLYYQPVSPSAQELAVKRRIDEIYTAHPFYGIRRIGAQLRAEGVLINHKAVARHMREMGLAGIAPGPATSRGGKRASDSIHPYLLKGVVAQYPNHVWGVDITYIRLSESWLYLVAVLDWHSRYVVSWELSHTLSQPFVMAAARRALQTATPLIWNSDQGSQFTSAQYTGLLSQAGVQISMDGRGRFVDNIFTERLWRTIKYEEVYLHEYICPREAHRGLSGYLDFYNHQRLHQALGYRTPASVYYQDQDNQIQAEKGEEFTLMMAG